MPSNVSLPAERPDIASLRERLRRDTSGEHEVLDRRFEGMFEAGDLRRYAVFLAMNLAAHRAIEPILAASPPHAGWSAGSRLAALEADAASLALPDRARTPFPIPVPDGPQAFGIAYVLEGSRLGARFMAKALRDRPGPGPGPDGRREIPLRYLEASSDVAPFRDLLAAMAEAIVAEDERRRAIDAADATFRFFRETADQLDETGTAQP